MAKTDWNSDNHRSKNISFFLLMAITIAFITFGGFSSSYFLPILNGTLRPIAPLVHFHGLFSFMWIALLVLQAALINSNNVALHRSLGLAGISIATGLIIFAFIAMISLAGPQIELGSYPFVYNTLYINLASTVIFFILFALAIANVRNSDTHKRLIVLATIGYMGGGINRFYQYLFQVEIAPYWFLYIVEDILVFFILVYDKKTLGKFHWATVFGAIVIVAPQLSHIAIIESNGFRAVARWLVSLGGFG